MAVSGRAESSKPFFAWRRVALVAALFMTVLGAILWTWWRLPPVEGLTGTATYGQNIPGDLGTVLQMLGIEFAVALLSAQPWTARPSRIWLGIAGVLFGAWGLLHFLMLHSPPVMFMHTLFLPILALAFLGAIPALSIGRRDAVSSATAI